jgi:ABC-2 type transport system permease protein
MLTLLKTSLLLLVRDRANLFFILLFPSLLVLILGNALSFLDNAETPIDPFTVEYRVSTTSPDDVAAIDAFVDSVNQSGVVSFALAYDDADNQNSPGATDASNGEIPVLSAYKLEQGTIAAFVAFTQTPNQTLSINIHKGLDSAQNRAVSMMLEGFSIQSGTYSALAQSYLQTLLEQSANPPGALSDPGSGDDFLSQSQIQQTIDEAFASLPPTTNLVSSATAGYQRSMLDYYAVTMIVMILVMGGSIGGASLLYERRKEGTVRRELSTSISSTRLYLQFLLETLLQNIIQVGAVMLSSTLLFGAHYGATWQDNVLLFAMLFSVGMAISALFLIVGIFIKFDPTAILMPISWVFLFLGGTFSKPINIPGLSEYLPTSMAQNAAFDLTVFGNTQASLTVLAVSLGIIIVATGVGSALFKRKGAL